MEHASTAGQSSIAPRKTFLGLADAFEKLLTQFVVARHVAFEEAQARELKPGVIGGHRRREVFGG
jgi:hypothetical protein